MSSSDEEPLFDASPTSSLGDERLFETDQSREPGTPAARQLPQAVPVHDSDLDPDPEPEPEPEPEQPEPRAGALPEGVPPEPRALSRSAAAPSTPVGEPAVSASSGRPNRTGLDMQTLKMKLDSSKKTLEFFERAGEERGVAQTKADITELEAAIEAARERGEVAQGEQDALEKAEEEQDGWKPLSCILARPKGEVQLYLTGSTAPGGKVSFRVDWRMSNVRLDGKAGSPPHPKAGGLQLWRLTEHGQLVCKSAPDLCVEIDRNCRDEGAVLAMCPLKDVPPPPVKSGDPGWQQDADAPKCNGCEKSFSLTRWQHHCRQCGKVFCDVCSSRKHTLGEELVDARVCDKCKESLVGEPKNQLWDCATAMEGYTVVTIIASKLNGLCLARGESLGSGPEVPDSYSCAATVKKPARVASQLRGW